MFEQVTDYIGENVVLPDNYLEYYSAEPNVSCYSYFDYQSHDSFYVFFTISEMHYMNFFDDFIRKLESNGFTCRDDEYGDYEYINGNTVIHFGNVRESYVYNPSTGENQFEYYYFNYYIYFI